MSTKSEKDAELLALYHGDDQHGHLVGTPHADGLRAVAAAAWAECSQARRYGIKNNPYTAENALVTDERTE